MNTFIHNLIAILTHRNKGVTSWSFVGFCVVKRQENGDADFGRQENGGATLGRRVNVGERSLLGFLVALTSSIFLLVFLTLFTATYTNAAPNYQMNYQGKLTNASNVAVADGTYNMRFWLLTSSSIATTSAVWTETLTSTNKVQVTSGLFSVMLGSTSPLTGVDFNQTLYLGVEVGGTSTPAWDGEMSPRKILGTVPSAFEAKNAQTFAGIATTSFLRRDQNDSASGLLTFTGGIVSTASSTITNLTTLIATTTTLVVNGSSFNNLAGSGLLNTAGTLTCATSSISTFGCLTFTDWTSFNNKVSSTSIDTSAELAALLTDETGTAGNAVFSGNPLLQGFRSSASSTIGDGTATGGLTIAGNSTTTGNAYFAGNVGIGTTTLSSMLTVQGTAGNADTFRISSSTGSTTLAMLANGNLELPGQLISAGIDWTARSATEANSWLSVTYGNGLFVAVAYTGTNRVMTSPDGITWTARAAAEANTWYSITYGNGLFVAVSSGGTNRVMTSPDGITWTARVAAEANSWYSITYGNGLFVAVSSDGTNRVMTSPDGITWTARSAAEANSWNSVTYGNGLFVAVANTGTNRVMTSPNGITWTARSAAAANSWLSVTYGNGKFVAVSIDGTNRVMTSPDGITWTARSAAEANTWYSVTYGNGLFVAVAGNGTNRVMTSPDGIIWNARSASEANTWLSVTYGNGKFVAVSSNGTNRVMTSGKSSINALAHNNIYQGGMSVLGGAFNIGTTTSVGNPAHNNILNIASTTGSSLFTVLANGNVGIGTTTPYAKLTVSGGLGLTGALYDRTASAGTNGQVLQTTGTGVQWVATSSLGISGVSTFLSLTDTPSSFTANRISFTNSGATALTDSANLTFDGSLFNITGNLRATASSTIGDGTATGGLTISGGATTTGNAYFAGNVGIGTTTPSATLALTGTAGTQNLFAFASSTNSNLLTLGADGRLTFGNSATANILMNGGATSSNPFLGDSNVAIGNKAFSYYAAGAQYNIALGEQALYGSSGAISGDYNFAAGYQALMKNTTGSYNNAFGLSALSNNTSGNSNNALGWLALQFNSIGLYNNALGSSALRDNTTGSYNNAFGYHAFQSNTTGSSNNALGWSALFSNKNGSHNTGIGYYAGALLGGTATSSYNTYIGYQSGYNQTQGDHNLVMGTNAGYNLSTATSTTLLGAFTNVLSATGISSSTALGAGAFLTRSNTMVLGGTGANAVDIVTGTSTPWAKLSIMNTYGATTPLFDVATTTSSTYATSSLFRVNSDGNIGIGTTTPYAKLTVAGSLGLTGALYDRTASAGTNGQVLQTTGTGVQWVATSSLGISGVSTFLSLTDTPSSFTANRISFTNSGATALTDSANLTFDGSLLTITGGLRATASSTIGDGTDVGGLTIAGNSTTTGNAYFASNVGIGTTTPTSQLTLDKTGIDGMQVPGIRQYLQFTNSTNGTAYYGNHTYIVNAPTATNTLIGTMIRVEDSSVYGNTVRGLEVQAHRGTNTNGENTAINAYGRTFGVKGTTEGDAGFVARPAGIFAETRGTTQGNALRAYSGSITTEDLVSIFHDTSAYAGTALSIDMANTSGTFASTSSRFLNLKKNNISQFTVMHNGYTGIGTSSPSRLLTVASDAYIGGNLTTASSTLGYASTTALTVLGNSYFNNASFTFASSTYASTTNITLSGKFFDGANSAGTNGQVLQTTGTGVQWVATSSLGISGGASTFLGLTDTPSSFTANRISFTNSGATALTDSANLTFDGSLLTITGSLRATASSTIGDGTATGGLTISGGATTTGNAYFAGNVGVGSTSPNAKLTVVGTMALTQSGTNAIIMGDVSGNARGANSIDIQSERVSDTQVASSPNSVAIGLRNTVSGATGWNTAIGYNNTNSSLQDTTVVGSGNTSTGYLSTVIGTTNTSAGNWQTVVGNINTIASSYDRATAVGSLNVITYHAGSAFGNQNSAGNTATAIGTLNTASGDSSNAFGYRNTASGNYSSVFGYTSTSSAAGASTFGSGITNNIANSTQIGPSDSAKLTILSSGNVGIGTTTPSALLTIDKSGFTGDGAAGMKQYFGFTNSTLDALYYGDETYITNVPTATSTLVGNIIRIADSSTLGNTVRGFEAQAFRGTNTKGENTGLSGFGRTFGVRGTTIGDAGDTFLPAGVFAESQGTSQGNALRAYSGTMTTESLVSFFHDTSNFTGTGLKMDFGNAGGSFAATSSAKFIDLKVGGTSKFIVSANGSTTIGDGTVNAGLIIPRGGICVDNDGSCVSTTTGQIRSVTSALGNSDLAEMYFSHEALQTGEIVALSGGLSVKRADGDTAEDIIGVVSTKPGMTLGFDDTSLRKGEGGYPIGLKGRVPVKLSTENGPIKKGDRIALSSVPGVGMKATESSRVVGIALEDYNGERAYSEGFINQFGDDMVKERVVIRTKPDPLTQNGCYNGGGSALGEKPCVAQKVSTKTVITESPEKTRDEMMRELVNQPAVSVQTAQGDTASVGQALMFIELTWYQTNHERMVLNELSTTTSFFENGETIWTRLKLLATRFVDGVLSVVGIKADRVDVKNELCVDGVCVNADDLRAILQNAHINNGTGGGQTVVTPPPPEVPPSDTPPAGGGESEESDGGGVTDTTEDTSGVDGGEDTDGPSSDTSTSGETTETVAPPPTTHPATEETPPESTPPVESTPVSVPAQTPTPTPVTPTP